VRRILTWLFPSALLAAVATQPLEGCSDNGSANSGGGDASAPPGESSSGGSSSWAGQSGSSSSGSGGGSSSGSATSSGGNPFAGLDAAWDGGACAAIPGSDLRAHASPAYGTVTGTGLDALLCPGGAGAVILSAGASYDTAPFIFELDYTLAGGAADFLFEAPADASNGELSVLLGISSTSPGSYSSPAGSECGTMAFTYYLPVPPGLDCEAGAPPDCPPGCGTICDNIIGGGCEPCRPQPPGVSYSAQGNADCIGDTLTALGSWTLSLTSVTEADGGTAGGLTYYTPHGTLTATMVNAGDAGADTATLSASF
jgi:hypothetical protein